MNQMLMITGTAQVTAEDAIIMEYARAMRIQITANMTAVKLNAAIINASRMRQLIIVQRIAVIIHAITACVRNHATLTMDAMKMTASHVIMIVTVIIMKETHALTAVTAVTITAVTETSRRNATAQMKDSLSVEEGRNYANSI